MLSSNRRSECAGIFFRTADLGEHAFVLGKLRLKLHRALCPDINAHARLLVDVSNREDFIHDTMFVHFF